MDLSFSLAVGRRVPIHTSGEFSFLPEVTRPDEGKERFLGLVGVAETNVLFPCSVLSLCVICAYLVLAMCFIRASR